MRTGRRPEPWEPLSQPGSVAAVVGGLYVLIGVSRRPASGLALLTAGGGLAVLLLHRCVDVPAFGPLPAMYEPVWFFDKSPTALAQTAALVLAAAALTRRARLHLAR